MDRGEVGCEPPYWPRWALVKHEWEYVEWTPLNVSIIWYGDAYSGIVPYSVERVGAISRKEETTNYWKNVKNVGNVLLKNSIYMYAHNKADNEELDELEES